jgi:cytochrome c-type biogenesis protein CcmH/NrfG
MKSWHLLVLASFLLPQLTSAQMSQLASNSVPSAARETVVLTGKVAAEDGRALDTSVEVVLECGSEIRAHAYSAQKGSFSITIGGATSPTSLFSPQNGGAMLSDSDWSTCDLYGVLPGYKSEHLHVSQTPTSGITEMGTITLHPTSRDHTFTVSVTSLAAPDKAKQALRKGEEQAKKGKWSAACDYFKRAISAYPRYALAWLELGRAQARQNSFVEAQKSFRESVKQDSGFVAGYDALAKLALQQGNWRDLADVTQRILQFAPDSGPEYWFFNAVANYNLKNVADAETSIQRALRQDPKHQIPQTEYLYGLILAEKHDYNSAIEHVNTYLELAPQATDADSARRALAELQNRSQLSQK